jgi:hypothetical protein
MSPNTSWSKFLSEGAIIVVSILIAFWIDAWWDERQKRDDERATLEVLLAEFLQIKENIDDIQDYQVAILESVYRLAELSESPDPDISDNDLNLLLGDLTWHSTPENFAAPKLNAIIEQGDISLITNRELRYQLLSLPDKLAWIRSSLFQDQDFMASMIDPYLIRNSSYLHIQHAGQKRPGSSGFVFPSPPFNPASSVSHKDLLESREFQNLVMVRSGLLEEIVSLDRTPDLPDQIDQTIVLIEQELN